MTRRYYNLPSLSALSIFEVCARHGSFKFAAQELGVTPGAVSRQIKALETELELALFVRTHHGVQLSEEGEILYQSIAFNLHQMSQTIMRLKKTQQNPVVTIASTPAFAAMWLMPRLQDFHEKYPDIVINHLVSDRPHHLKQAYVDLTIRYGFGNGTDEKALELFNDQIYPVASPAFYEKHKGAQISVSPQEIMEMPLLQLYEVDVDWTNWETWLRQNEMNPQTLNIRRFNSYDLVIKAALHGNGIALGWHSLIKEHLDSNQLKRLGPETMESNGAYHLCFSNNKALTQSSELLKQWLLDQAALA